MTSSCILVIEDDPLLLQAITKKLQLSEFEVIPCETGKKGIDYLKSGHKLPDAIWLDYYLTDMNGLDFMSQLKSVDSFIQIPIIVVSNSASDDKVHAMLALGADKYILKADHKLEEIIAVVKSMAVTEKGEQDQPS